MAQSAGVLSTSQVGSFDNKVQCPVCRLEMAAGQINSHLDSCLQEKPVGGVPGKKRRLNPNEKTGGIEVNHPAVNPLGPVGSTFPLFNKSRTPNGPSECASPSSRKQGGSVFCAEALHSQGDDSTCLPQHSLSPDAKKPNNLSEKLDGKPLADKMRPTTLNNYMGQNKVLGENTMLRNLLQANDIPSIILWGPPGCGKTTLAHIIAKNAQKSSSRFVTLSATSASTSDVREFIKQAQNEQRLFKRKTILFVDEIHRFNKMQQDTFLPHVECGTITLIGATTENPSFQVNTALLSRCRVIVLEKLSVEAMETILMRAVDSLGLKVLKDGEQLVGSSSDVSE
nr:Unknown (protein for MGC:179840) [Xenopus laevis]